MLALTRVSVLIVRSKSLVGHQRCKTHKVARIQVFLVQIKKSVPINHIALIN